MKVLLFSKDPALFREGDGRIGDARRRHAFYAARLRERHPGSEIRVIGYTRASERHRTHEVAPGLTLYPTNSRLRLLYLAGAALCLREVLADGWRPDVISAQTPWEEGVLGLAVARIVGAAFVAQVHLDLFAAEWRREHFLNGWRRAVAHQVIKRADVVRTVSERLGRMLVERYASLSGRVQVAPVGVDFEPAARGERGEGGLDSAHPLVLFVGRLCEAKNLPLWLDVAQIVSQQVPGARFLIVGDGENRDDLEARTKALGLKERVKFAGPVAHSELPAIYANADVFLLTSNHEGFGRVILEAQLAGVPVVSTACSGPEDLIVHGETGLLFQKGDKEGLAAGIVSVLTQQGVAYGLRKLALSRSKAQFALVGLTDRLIGAWELSAARIKRAGG
jgi:glycosyltransferase involved in cell wall biosynthesis